MRSTRRKRGQAILEYILMTLMIAVTIAVTIRNTNRGIFSLWTFMALGVALPCADCKASGGNVPRDAYPSSYQGPTNTLGGGQSSN